MQLFNNTVSSNIGSNTFAIGSNDVTATKTSYSPQEFCLNQSPCTLQQFETLDADNKLEALKDIINVILLR